MKQDIEKFQQAILNAEYTISTEQLQQIDNLESTLESVNLQLERYVSQIDKYDYILAIASGVLCGVIDSMFVGSLSVTADDIILSHKQVNGFIEQYAKRNGWNGDGRLKSAVAFLEDKYPVAQDSIFKGNIQAVNAANHHLADMAHHPTPIGLVSAILVHFFRVGLFLNKDGEWHVQKIPTNGREIIEIWTPVIISGLLNWLVNIAETNYEIATGDEVPDAIHKIAKIMASSPVILEVIHVVNNWAGHMVSDVAGSKQTAGAGMGIPGVFLSLAYEIAGLPILKDSGLTQKLNELYVNKDYRINFRKELPLYKNIGKQAIPVLLNDIIVRCFYLIRNLITEIDQVASLSEVKWVKVLPINNRTIDQMIEISSLTFSFADAADAAGRAVIESGGNFVISAGRFATRLNYIGAGKTLVSVVREISNEKAEIQLLHEKRLLSEQHSTLTVDAITAYRKQLDFLVSQYIAETVETFMNGFSLMDKGLATGDSNLFIKGNVIIQNRFGRNA
ncbi:MAG: hypothetical protein II670_08615, partial [Alphaproteobacteria bacterium]|nr:hypothetical protein [Alphaproteobacteria bacterium]